MEADVPRLIQEVRDENRARWRWVLRVTADPNIYVSALSARRGHPYEFLRLAGMEKLCLAVSDAILDEAADLLARKFDWPQDDRGGKTPD